MIILNFAHPLTDVQQKQIEELAEQEIERIITIKTHFDTEKSYVSQVLDMLNEVKMSSEDFQTETILINPPSFNVIACVLIAKLHGMMGYFPPIIRIRPVANSVTPKFEVAEIINLQKVREQAREKR